MAKVKTVYVCQQCGYETYKWLGKCPNCNSWNSMTEEEKKTELVKQGNSLIRSKPVSISKVKSGEYERLDTGITELNRVLGGGIVKSSLTLISGAPGIGKSTLLLQTADNIAKRYGTVLYISGEESEEQIKMRGDRLDAISPNLFVLAETNISNIEVHIESVSPVFVIVDSIQTLYKETVSSAPGGVSQVRECANELMRIAKGSGIPFFIVAHVTKQGELAGPRVLEHMVDTVLSFEGQRTEEVRILRTIKNRFGTTSEIGVFEMCGSGLKEISNPSEVFIEETEYQKEGSAIIGVMEGSRPILVEVQALAAETKLAMPRRTAIGIDLSRLYLILAVLEKKLKIPFYDKDVYVNVVGGLNIEGTSGDLGIALAILSSVKSKEGKLSKMLAIGEIGLTGEVRPVSNCERIVNEGYKMGFENIIVSIRNLDKLDKKNYKKAIGVSTLKDAVDKVFK